MTSQSYSFPQFSNFYSISSPYNTIKNISVFKNYQKKNQKEKKNLIDKRGNVVFSLTNTKFYTNPPSEKNYSGIAMLDEVTGIIQNTNLSSRYNRKKNKVILPDITYTYLLKKNRKQCRKFDLQRHEKSLSKSLQILRDKNDLRNFHFPKYYSYQPPGTPRCIQDVYIKYNNEKRNIKLKIMEDEDYNELKHKVVSFRRLLYNPKNV